jgi:translation initiation factor 3 subunit F
LAAEFRPLSLELTATEAEKLAMGALAQSRGTNAVVPQTLEQSVEKLLALLDSVTSYVDDVVEGRVQPDPEVGKRISDLVSAVPHISPDAFSSSLSKSLQDLLMLTMLSNMTKAQLSISERMNSVI